MSKSLSSRLVSRILKSVLVLAIAFLIFSITGQLGRTESRAIANFVRDSITTSPDPSPDAPNSPLTTPRVHPLPFSLVQLDPSPNDDSSAYFAEIKPTPLGYLVWSQFPVQIYLDQPLDNLSISEQERFANWTGAVEQSIQEWGQYLSLVIGTQLESADIEIRRSFPPQRATRNPTTGVMEIPRAAAAQTRYQFYLQTPERRLAHRFTIYLSPNQTPEYTLATARHELGHALGIWGHSPLETDVMYFSQVRTPPPISPRDINTLRKIYQQPTQLGWPVEGK